MWKYGNSYADNVDNVVVLFKKKNVCVQNNVMPVDLLHNNLKITILA